MANADSYINQYEESKRNEPLYLQQLYRQAKQQQAERNAAEQRHKRSLQDNVENLFR